MPAKSQAQRRWAFGAKGKTWAKAHGYDNPGKLPARVKKKKAAMKPKKRKAKAAPKRKAKPKPKKKRGSMYGY